MFNRDLIRSIEEINRRGEQNSTRMMERFDRHDEASRRHEEAFDRMMARFDRHDEASRRHEEAFERHEGAFDRHEEAFERMMARFDRLEIQDEQHHQFMRDITLRVERSGNAQVAALNKVTERLGRVDTRLDDLREEDRAQREALLKILDRMDRQDRP